VTDGSAPTDFGRLKAAQSKKFAGLLYLLRNIQSEKSKKKSQSPSGPVLPEKSGHSSYLLREHRVLSTTEKSTDSTLSHWKYILGNVIAYSVCIAKEVHAQKNDWRTFVRAALLVTAIPTVVTRKQWITDIKTLPTIAQRVDRPIARF
jgi:hypothetical protein